ncbi:hypothetical protein A3206_07720 [Candidatus Methanomassiliicoccus intestinalis]|uniref:Phosphoesterase n=1 Tax=Methanomassiliicoccus intestinalis (strain Issoire-Mx1) TaxID=1295009 RepID=R9T892_METII|nr:YfcE family phosphodiesterase [Candidatus Methanomassiliicoccus intestinalis]AGN26925.1 metallophosphoesterase [Candidatus Methanomassiliicoccus intestinalis Issoire-Mx1]TQS81339.1 MAG: hypothetical protein A3206_07720 [Candidatus Methanomassiliicoccus intestinalis]
MGKTESLQDLAIQTLLEPAETLIKLSSLKNFEEEDIHDIRVASRRLRTGIPIFSSCFEGKEAAKWLKALKSLTNSLGDARDSDVFIKYLSRYEDQPLTEIVERLKVSREKSYIFAKKRISQMHKSGILEDIISNLKEINCSDKNCYSLGLANICVRYSAVEKYSRNLDDVYDKTGHHKMRIAVKKFRYCLEVFSPLFDDKLSAELASLKELQDSLGKMHDFDVFLEKIPEIIRESVFEGADMDKILELQDLLLKNCRESRDRLYTETRKVWKRLNDEYYKEHLTAKFEENLPDCLKEMQSQKLMIVSDIHGSYDSLVKALNDAICRGVGGILCLGDISGRGDTDACLRLLKQNNAICIHGNYDLATAEIYWSSEFFKSRYELKDSMKNISLESINEILTFPSRLRLKVSDKRILMVHDSPAGGKERLGPKTPADRLACLADMSQADIVLMGHSHLPFIRRVNEVLFINPGSIGNIKDSDARPSYAVLDVSTGEAEIIKLDDGFSEVSSRCRLEDIHTEDRKKNAEISGGIDDVFRLAENLDINISHAAAVARLSSSIFCNTCGLHKLYEDDLTLLQYAAILHDAGWLMGKRDHEKNSYKIIMDLSLPVSSNDKNIIACIARYHRGDLPELDDPEIKDVSNTDLNRILRLAGILRIADDIANQTDMEEITNCPVINGRLEIFLSQKTDDIFLKKNDLFEKVFKYKVEVL